MIGLALTRCIPLAATNMDAGLRRHDEVEGHRAGTLSTIIPAQALLVDAPENVITARITQPTRETVIPVPAPHVDTPATVIPAQAGIHASFNTRALEILHDTRRQATRLA